MRHFLFYMLAATLPAVTLARQESFCEEKAPHRGRLFGRPTYYNLQENIPGYIFFEDKRIHGRIHGPTFWHIRGKLQDELSLEALLVDPVIYSLNRPQDLEGSFTGSIGRGEVTLKWESGATIVGRTNVGDFDIKGETHVEYSP
ncbi:hypothetical protein BGZ80_006364 [Entomortierella chlamydospora]|uniref:Secreted protein n=1 Tax=Entomortierella chlamydospora TaxID=101097 RepID=A0A9P6MZ83_9FUNG